MSTIRLDQPWVAKNRWGDPIPTTYLVHAGQAYSLDEDGDLLCASLDDDGRVDVDSWAFPEFGRLPDDLNAALRDLERRVVALLSALPERMPTS